MAAGVTHQQNAAFKFIAGYVREHDGTPPSYAEIAGAIGIRSKSGVSRLVSGLEARGLIRRHGGLARSIVIVGGEGGGAPACILDSLPPILAQKFKRHCAQRGETPESVAGELIRLFIEQLETRETT